MKRVRPKLTYANVVSSLCLFLLLGGGAYAASALKANSVGTKQLKNNAVNGAKVADGSLSGSDIGGPVNNASQAASASQAANAAALGGVPASGYAPSSLKFGEVATEESVTADGPTSLPTLGPSVTVDVPNGGLVLIYTAVDVKNAVDLTGSCGVWLTDSGGDFTDFPKMNTPSAGYLTVYPSWDVAGAQALAYGTFVPVAASPGTHTYSLRYGRYTPGHPSLQCFYRNRRLWVDVLH